MSTKRPVNLDLTTIKLPITALVSIAHRISGVILFFAIPYILFLLNCSFISPEVFSALVVWMRQPWVLFINWGFISVAGLHIIAGCRHLMDDMSWLPSSYAVGRLTAWLVFALSLVWTVLVGVWLW